MKIPDVKTAVDKAWEKLQHLPAWKEFKVRSKSDVVRDKEGEQDCSFLNTHGPLPSWTNKSKHTKDVSYLRGDIETNPGIMPSLRMQGAFKVLDAEAVE